MIKKEDVQKIIKPFICGLCIILTGCGGASLARTSTFEDTYEEEAEQPVNIYTSSASVIIENVSPDNHIVNMYLLDKNKSKTMGYDGRTLVQDKYGSPMTMAQLKAGDLAEITYNAELDRLGTVALSGDAWSYEGVAKYNLDAGSGSVSIGGEVYSLDREVMAFSSERPIDVEEIIRQDVVSFNGKGHNVLSITVDKGHGYLDLVNDEAVLGGWIEIGQSVISQIAPDMYFTVPEGTYSVRLTGEGVEETREVTIERNKETILDLSDVEVKQPENGTIIFDITPKSATVYVDNEKVETTYPVRVPLGIHKVTAEASGYDSLSEYVKVEGKAVTVSMNLSQATVSGNSIFDDAKEEEIKGNGNITIEAPRGASVYQDNLYKGIAPVTYAKTPGDHTITLRKEGYITRSYNITVADDNQDVTYSFPELDPENGGISDQYTVSGNSLIKNNVSTVSGNTVSGNNTNQNNVYNSNGNNWQTSTR